MTSKTIATTFDSQAFASSPEAPVDCALCPRLVAYRRENRVAEPAWHNAPVGSFGDPDAQLLIVGLGPGRGGANRTGRPFTGDYAGVLLYDTLAAFGFSRGAFSARVDDGLILVNAMIANAVRCAPPGNKPVGVEVNACRAFLAARISAMPRLAAILALGKIAHDSTVRALGGKPSATPFRHAARHRLAGLDLFDSYHCSRYNTNTRRLTADMFRAVFADIKRRLDDAPRAE